MRWLPDDSGVLLRTNPSFLPKVLLPQFINQSISLAAFQSAQQSDHLGGSPLVSCASPERDM